MRTNRILTALAALVLAAMAPEPTLFAQEPPASQTSPAPSDRSSDEIERLRWRIWRPILRVAQHYTLPNGEIVREVRVVFGNVTIEGRVTDDVIVTMGSARLGPTAIVDGSLAVFGGSATIDQGASIGRDLVVFGGTVTAPPGFSPASHHVVVGSPWLGAILEDVYPWITRGLLWGRLIVPDIGWIWGVVGIFFLLYLVLNTVFDRPIAACADALGTRPLSTFMVGLLVLLLLVPVLAIVAATVIGLLVVPFVLCAAIVAALIGKVGVARAIGRSFLRFESPEGRARATAAFVIGFGLLILAYMVPVLGFVTWALTSVLGLGAATVTLRAMLRRERPERPEKRRKPAGLEEGVAQEAAGVATIAPEPLAAPTVAPAFAAPVEPPLGVAPAVAARVEPPRPIFSEGLAQYPRATFLDRLAAFVLDAVLVAIINVMLDMERVEGFYLFLLFAYHVAFWAWKGTTLGGIVCSVRVIRTHGAELRFADAMVRGLSGILSIAALGLGCFWMLQDPESQMWHDKIAGTLVVKVPRELAFV